MIGRNSALKRVLDDAIDLLEQARDQADDQVRQRLVREAIGVMEEHRHTRKLTPSIGGFAADGELDRAIELLRKLEEGPEKRPGKPAEKPKGKPKRAILVKGCLGLVIPFAMAMLFFAMSLSGNDRSPALRALEECRESQQALGSPIEVRWLALPPGGGPDTHDASDTARRVVPVQGSVASGRYTYLAENTHGAWVVRHGAVEVDGQHLAVMPCDGPISESDAEGLLRQGFHGEGRVRETSGSAPVQTGAQCTVEVHRDTRFPDVTYNCRVVVTCDGRILYGADESTGYVFCSARDGAPSRAVDGAGSNSGQGTDPMLQLALPDGEVRVSEDTGWSVVVEVPTGS